MNEHVKEIAERYGLTGANFYISSRELELFAESIIRECIYTVNRRYMGDNNREDMEVRRCVQALRDRFGIKPY